ncbi:MAG TPA: tetratricopeptide repeat protein [Candidatus Omnitrophota bacterium]|nr:tetratricopeptide repeat protein [Candidatus Omnitrophota bacterium]
MGDNFWKKFDYLTGLLPFASIFALVVISANLEIKDLDLWLHLGMGKFITLNHFVPSADILSCTIQGSPWVNHEWLFQVAVYNIFNRWGADGLILMQVVVVGCTMLLLLCLGYDKKRQLLTAFILFLTYMVFQQRFTIRPDIYSLLFFAVYIFVLSLHIDKKWAVPALFIVQILWSNMHGFFFFGPLFILIGIVSEWARRRIPLPLEWKQSGQLNDEEYSRMKWAFVFVLLACLFNPLFIQGAWYPVRVFFSLSGENKIFFDFIQELKQPITQATLLNENHYFYYKMMIFFSVISFALNYRRIDISALLFWLAFLVFSLKAVRNTPFFAFAAYLVIITNLVNINFENIVPVRFTIKKFQYLTAIVLNFLFLSWIFGFFQILSGRAYYDFDKYELKSEFGGISQRAYPDKAVDFLVKNEIQGNFFNDFNSGAYLIGRTFPDIKVFIDGRTEVYGGNFFKKYQEIWERGNADLFEEAVNKFHITGALFNSSRQFIPKKILNYLYRREDWHVVYFDYDAVIFLRDVEANKDIIDRFEIDLSRWEAPAMDLFKLGTLRVQPYRPYYRAYTLESLGLDDAALKELEEAVRADPFYAEAHDLMGKIYGKKKDFQKAFEHFRIAVTAMPNNKEKRYNLALSYFDLGQYAGAAHQYDVITKKWPKDPKGYFLLTKAYIMDGKYPEAFEALAQARRLVSGDVQALLELGDLAKGQKAYAQARNIYQMALEADPLSASVYKKLGFASLEEHDFLRAKTEFQKALSLSPEDEEITRALEDLSGKL